MKKITKILVTGSGGFVGSRFMEYYKSYFELSALLPGMLKTSDRTSVIKAAVEAKPDAIVHLAAISDTAYCETHKEEAYRANVVLPEWIAEAAKTLNSKLICFSSDQVYSGNTGIKPLDESQSNPSNVYGCQKLEMERRVLAVLPEAVMLRATWMYDLPRDGLPIHENFLLRLIHAVQNKEKLKFSSNDRRGITYVRSAVEKLADALKLPGGVYNYGSPNIYNMYETAIRFRDELGLALEIEDDTGRVSRNLSISCEKLNGFGIIFEDTTSGIRRCMNDYKKF